jgi:DNA mismatch repair protein MutS2
MTMIDDMHIAAAEDGPAVPPSRGGRPFSSEQLELDKVLAMLAARTSFSAGRELALGLAPSSDLATVERRQAATEEARRLPELKPGLGLGRARDIRATVQRAALGGLLQPVELLDVAATIRVARLWGSTLTRLRGTFPVLADVAERLDEHRPIQEEIDQAIDESGEVSDHASPELRRIRNGLRVAQDRLLTHLRELLNSPAVRPALQDAVITQRNGRYVLPVRADSKGKVKGIVHDQSASGQTLFVEPLAIVEAGNRVRQLEAEERHEVERILRALSGQVANQADGLAVTVEALGELDLHLAKGRLADETHATRPTLRPISPRSPRTPVLRLVEARHPLLRGEVVPISLELGADFDVLVITGPNTGGKTVALKTVGLLALMAQAGLQIPAKDGSELSVFRAVYADIGDEQSIEQSLSTFSSHVSHIVQMLDRVDAGSLVLLDELGAGTDPQEGSALARAIICYLLERGAFCVATTHYSELKAFAYATPRVENASVEFDVETLSPTYRLMVGVPGRSNALAIASRLGVPGDVVQHAESLLDPNAAQSEAMLANIQQELAEAERARQEAALHAEEAARLRRRLRDELRETERARREVLRQARAESEQALAEFRREGHRRIEALADGRPDRRQLRARLDDLESLAPLPAPADESPPAPEEPFNDEETGPAAIEVGEEIVVGRIGMPGTVLEIHDNGDADLDVRGMRVRVRAAELADARRASRRDRQALQEVDARRASAPVLARADSAPVAPPTQLDLRGLRRDEAGEALDRYLNDAYLAGIPRVRIVHGKGTGAVRAAVREQLSGHPLVSRFTSADRDSGGEGATEVSLVSS